MANHKSALKRIRQTVRKTAVNKNRISRIRTAVKKVEAAIGAKDKKAAILALGAAAPEISRGVNKGVLHKNNAARKISRLNKSVNAIA